MAGNARHDAHVDADRSGEVPQAAGRSARVDLEQDFKHRTYDPEWANALWRVLMHTRNVFEQFRGEFVGKAGVGASQLSCGRPAEGDGGGATMDARNEAQAPQLFAAGGVLDQDAASRDALRLAQGLGGQRGVLRVGSQELEERTGLAGASEHGVEQDDVEGAGGLVFEPGTVVGADDVYEAAGVAAVFREASQSGLCESGDEGV